MVNCFRSNSYYNLKKNSFFDITLLSLSDCKSTKKKRIYNLFIIKKAYFVYNYGVDSAKKNSLSPVPSPNGEGSENYYLQVKESLSPVPSPNGEGSENHCLQMKESLSPNPSPNGEGSDDYCLQMKEVSL